MEVISVVGVGMAGGGLNDFGFGREQDIQDRIDEQVRGCIDCVGC